MGRGAHANGEVSDAMREAATKLSNDLARTARDAREAADDLGEALRHSAEVVADKARSHARIANRDFRRGVRDHPVAWLGAAAGAGALLSLLMVAGRSRPN